MNSFSHHVMRYAEVKLIRRGDTMRFVFDALPANKITIEVDKGRFTVVDEEDAALARNHTLPAEGPGTEASEGATGTDRLDRGNG